jgi:protein-tyrosine phosphatase
MASLRSIPSLGNMSAGSSISSRSLGRSNRVLPEPRSSLRSIPDAPELGGGATGEVSWAPVRPSRPPVIFVLAGSDSSNSGDLGQVVGLDSREEEGVERGERGSPAAWSSPFRRMGASLSTLSGSGVNSSLSLSQRSLGGGGGGGGGAAPPLSVSGRTIVVPSGERSVEQRPSMRAGRVEAVLLAGQLRRAAAARARWRAAFRFVRAAARFLGGPARARRAAAEAAAAAKLSRVLQRAGAVRRDGGGGGGADAAAAAAAAGGAREPSPPWPLTVRVAIACCGEAAASHVVHPAPGRYPSFITPAVLIGAREDAADAFLLKRLGVTHVLNVAANLTPPREVLEQFVHLHLPLSDTPEQDMGAAFAAAATFIGDASRCGGRVLVHCAAGISRSVAVTLAYFTCPSGGDLPLRAAWALVKRRRAAALPNTGFRAQLGAFELEVRGRSSVAFLEVEEWDVGAWRTHPARQRVIAAAEEVAAENKRLGVRGRAARLLRGAWALAKTAAARALQAASRALD